VASRRIGRYAARIALILWGAISILLGGVLLLKHVIALPAPATTDTTLRDAVRTETPAGTWRAVHFMYRSCPCSRRTIAHLLDEPRDAALAQRVIMIDDDGAPGADDDQLRTAGFDVAVITPAQLTARYHVEVAPLLVLMTPGGELVYVGGYNRHKQSPAYEDRQILADARALRSPTALPVFGCATSQRLARVVDPFHFDRFR